MSMHGEHRMPLMAGCSMVLPGPMLDGASLVQLIDQYQVTNALGVPTIWQGLLTVAASRVLS